MSVFTPEVDEWVCQSSLAPRPTEIFVPVTIHVGPIWAYMDVPPTGPRCWGAGLTVSDTDAVLDECDHHHASQDDAWACGEAMARALAERLTGRR